MRVLRKWWIFIKQELCDWRMSEDDAERFRQEEVGAEHAKAHG